MFTGFGLDLGYSPTTIDMPPDPAPCLDAIDNLNTSWGELSDSVGGWIDDTGVTSGDIISDALDAYGDYEVYERVCPDNGFDLF